MTYSPEPGDKRQYLEGFDYFYTRFAGLYDWLVKRLPFWRRWIESALPWIQGPRVLEVSFGTGHLLTRYAGRFKAYGVDYNTRMVGRARMNLRDAGLTASLQRASVEALPYAGEAFDSVVNTMAFTGYPDALRAMSELSRVLKPGGRLIMVDVNYPSDGNWPGRTMANAWAFTGDIIRDMPALFRGFEIEYSDTEVGAFGSIHLYVARK